MVVDLQKLTSSWNDQHTRYRHVLNAQVNTCAVLIIKYLIPIHLS